MAVHYTIHADIVDIRTDTPVPGDVLLVDTNVWFWMAYSAASVSPRPQVLHYPAYLNKALGAGSAIYHSCLTFAELAHLIERNEREIYCQSVGRVEAKEYRHNFPSERQRVAGEIQAAWGQVTNLANPLEALVDAATVNAALGRLVTEALDGYDFFILESMKVHGIVQILTDDGDYAGIPGIQVFTANHNVVETAKTQGRLITR